VIGQVSHPDKTTGKIAYLNLYPLFKPIQDTQFHNASA
jgi:hypothetical protein